MLTKIMREGIQHYPSFLDRPAQLELIEILRHVVVEAPLFQLVMPRTGRPFSVRMTNLGTLGWVSDLEELELRLPLAASRSRGACRRR